MSRVTKQSIGRTSRRFSPLALLVLTAAIVALQAPVMAQAGTYPMYQCGAGHPNVATGWSVGAFSGSNVQLANSCSQGGTLGVDVFGAQQGVLGQGAPGSGGVSALNLTASGGPDITIASVSAGVVVSQNTGDTAYLGEKSGTTEFPLVTLPYGTGSPYSETNTWTLPQGATTFSITVECSTDMSQPACTFADPAAVPAVQNVTVMLDDSVAPTLSGVAGTLSTAARASSTVSGSQTIGFTGKDADSGVLSTTLTLTPEGSGTGYTKTTNFSAQCTYESWNACPLAQNVGPLAVPTATLKDGTYAVALSITDAAGNTASESLGTVKTDNSPTLSSTPAISGIAAVGQTLAAVPGSTSSNPEAGSLTTTGQWLRCDSAGENCTPIAGFTGTSYTVTQADIEHAIRYQETVGNNAGSAVGESAPLGPVTPSSAEREKTEREKAEKEKAEKEKAEKGQTGATGATGSSGAAGSSSSSGEGGVTINLPGSNLGSVELGSAASWVVSLHVNPLHVHRGTKIKLSGLVSTSPRPTEGKLIYLQARSVTSKWKGSGRSRHRVNVFGKWVTFQAFRAKAGGTFSSSYTFRLGGDHTYQFQAVAPAEGQYRNPTGTSKTITVKEI